MGTRAAGARLGPACAAVGLTLRTCQRWHGGATLKADARRREHRSADRVYHPPNRLSQAERDAALALVNAPRFASSSPHQIVAILADEGRYIASEATSYRLLRAADQSHSPGSQGPTQASSAALGGHRAQPSVSPLRKAVSLGLNPDSVAEC
jgi:putative transposase